MKQKIRLALIYGGKSGEHEVSLQTALSVINAVDREKYDILPIYISKQGEWIQGLQISGNVENVNQLTYGQNAGSAQGESNLPAIGQNRPPIVPYLLGEKNADDVVDVVFPLLHGPNGEDGTVQGFFELADLPYVGAGVLASSVGMDKIMMKTVYSSHNLPQVKYLSFMRKSWQQDQQSVYESVERELGYPCFVKPVNLGSSVGISKAKDRKHLDQAFAEAFQYDRKVIVEEFVDAREIEVAVLGNDDPQVSVAGEIIPSAEFYDYRAKYQDGDTSLIIPADIPNETYTEMCEIAVKAFTAIDGSGLARVDFFLRKSDNQLFINEINTMPGFTPFSMYPLLWKHTGISYPDLIDRLIQLALERHEEKLKNKYNFES